MLNDEIFLKRCYQLAEKGRGFTGLNPMVGAVFVYDNRIISEGYHKEYGGPHAEVNCLEPIVDQSILKSGTLYISMEPCSHMGKTPPCTQYIIRKGIQKVVIGSEDWNPKVNGRGISHLRNMGIHVRELNFQEINMRLNISFVVNQKKNRPYFTAKLASSADGFIGLEDRRVKITSLETDFWSHKLRSEVDAIMVGKNTWLQDRPILDARLYSNKKPTIIVLSHQPDLPHPSPDRKMIILNTHIDKKEGNIQYFAKNLTKIDNVAINLYRMGFGNVLIEGGVRLIGSFLNAECIDRFLFIQNNDLKLNQGIALPQIDLSSFHLMNTWNQGAVTCKTYCRNELFSI